VSTADDRRGHDRRELRAAVVCRRVVPEGAAADAHGETTDLSLGGFGARLDGSYSTGDVIDADLVLDTHVITVRALVVNATPDGDHQRINCAFSQPPAPVAAVIEKFLAARAADSA
jgi:hypothetical protein